MGLIGIIVLVGAVVATALRTLALGSNASRLTAQKVWEFDFGTRYGWLVMGLAVLTFVAFRGAPLPTFLTLAAYWLAGLAVIWLLPPHLASWL